MTDNVKRVQHTFPVPREVKKYMANPMDEILFTFVDPTDALVRLLVMSPLAGGREQKILMYYIQILHFSIEMIMYVYS
jgi:hypothetical protein